MRDTIAETLNDLYEGFDFDTEGEDYALTYSESDRLASERRAGRWAQINAARAAGPGVTWDGLLVQAVDEANATTDPNERTDALLRVAATALSYARSAQRQTDAFNADEKADGEDSE